MDKKLIIFEIVSALVMAVLVTGVLVVIAAIIGGNYMTDFTFMGDQGYEATGVLGIIFGLPLGGVLGAYMAGRRFGASEQKTSRSILLGLVVGMALLTMFFVNQSQGRYDQLRFYSGTTDIESMYPEFKNLECFAGCSYEYDKQGDDYYFAYIVHGSGIPIVKATCFKVDTASVITKIGEFPDPADSYVGYRDIDPKSCKGVK